MDNVRNVYKGAQRSKERGVFPSQAPSSLVVEAKQAGPVWGGRGRGVRRLWGQDTTDGGGGSKGGAEDKRAPLAAPEPRLVPLSSSSWKRQLRAQRVERRRQKTRFQMRDAPPARLLLEQGLSRVPGPRRV